MTCCLNLRATNYNNYSEFIDQNNEHRILRSELIEVPTFTMN